METRDDAALLEAIAAQRDRDAFALLVSRYEQRAYNAALYITGSREAAEEATQEAWLDVWLQASFFEAQRGSASAWIMRIVAHKGINQGRKIRRDRGHMKELMAGEPAATGPLPAEALARQETLSALRRALSELPPFERQVLALHFATGLSQQEIGQALSASQQAISYRLKSALDSLRVSLSKAGCAAALPLVTADGLSEAICLGGEAPAGLRERVLESLAQAARESLRASRRVAAAGSWSQGLLLPAGLVLATAAAVTFWWAAGTKPAAPKTPAETPSEPSKGVPSSPAPGLKEAGMFVRHWDFNTPEQAQDFKIVRGSWHFVSPGGPDGSACMQCENETVVLLNFDIPRLPVRISYQWKSIAPTKAKGWGSVIMWDREGKCASLLGIWNSPVQPIEFVHKDVFVTARTTDDWSGGIRKNLVAHLAREGSSRLQICLWGDQFIDNIAVQEISTGDVPDVSEFLDALDGIAAGRRVGQVDLPALKMFPGKKLSVSFGNAPAWTNARP